MIKKMLPVKKQVDKTVIISLEGPFIHVTKTILIAFSANAHFYACDSARVFQFIEAVWDLYLKL